MHCLPRFHQNMENKHELCKFQVNIKLCPCVISILDILTLAGFPGKART